MDRVEQLTAALRECQQVLAMMVSSEAIQQTTVLNAFAAAVAAEAKARSVLSEASPSPSPQIQDE